MDKSIDLSNKCIIALGDSITEGCGAEKNWLIYLEEFSGIKTINYGVAGTSIGEKLGSKWATETAFINRVQHIKEPCDYICIFGGTNDYGNYEGITKLGNFEDRRKDSFYGAYHLLCEHFKKAYPKSKIFILTPLMRCFFKEREDYERNDEGYNLEDLRIAIKEVAKYHEIPVLDIHKLIDIDPNNKLQREKFMPDGLHPNDLGQNKIAKLVLDFMQTLD